MISVIIPALNEEKTIIGCIESVLKEGVPCEIIVADGGSTDRTLELALSQTGVIVTDSPKGRGIQMNSGSAVAAGDILLFLHADTVLEQGWHNAVTDALEDPSVIGGAFRFSIDNPSAKYRIVEAWVRLRCLIFSLPYGDQAIFIRKSAFDSICGYKEIPLMEDVDIISRMKKQGNLALLKKKAVTSVRRWLSRGILRTAIVNQITMIMYLLGVSPERLARFYYR